MISSPAICSALSVPLIMTRLSGITVVTLTALIGSASPSLLPIIGRIVIAVSACSSGAVRMRVLILLARLS